MPISRRSGATKSPRRGVAHHALADGDPARVVLLEPGDHPQRRRLAAARRPEQDDETAVGHHERHAVDGRTAPKRLLTPSTSTFGIGDRRSVRIRRRAGPGAQPGALSDGCPWPAPNRDLLGELEHLVLELGIRGAEELGLRQRPHLGRRSAPRARPSTPTKPDVGVQELHLVAQEEVHEQAGRVRMGRALEDGAVEAHVGRALAGDDRLHGQALQIEDVGQVNGMYSGYSPRAMRR